MQLSWNEHFNQIVIPAWQAYLRAEQCLTDAVIAKDTPQIKKNGYIALREGGAATFYVHHFGEIILRARPEWLPAEYTKPRQVSEWLSQYCTMMRTEEQVNDVFLLGDVADALKHAVLTWRTNDRDVSDKDAVLVVRRGYGAGKYGEGKYGGVDQVLVLAKSGSRTLSAILQNVIDAWRRAANIELPQIGSA